MQIELLKAYQPPCITLVIVSPSLTILNSGSPSINLVSCVIDGSVTQGKNNMLQIVIKIFTVFHRTEMKLALSPLR